MVGLTPAGDTSPPRSSSSGPLPASRLVFFFSFSSFQSLDGGFPPQTGVFVRAFLCFSPWLLFFNFGLSPSSFFFFFLVEIVRALIEVLKCSKLGGLLSSSLNPPSSLSAEFLTHLLCLSCVFHLEVRCRQRSRRASCFLKMDYMWWVYVVSTAAVLLITVGVFVYKRESRRVEVKLQETDEAKEELLDDFRGRAVKRIQQMNQLRKSPSKLKLALSQYLQNRRAYKKVVADSRLEKGDGMRSLYKLPDDVQTHPLVPLVRPSRSSAADGGGDSPSAPFGLRRPKNPDDEALLRRREFAFKTLKHNFDFLDPEQLAALSFDATELRISRGDVLVTEGSKVETPSLYIVESGVLECTCDGGSFRPHFFLCLTLFSVFGRLRGCPSVACRLSVGRSVVRRLPVGEMHCVRVCTLTLLCCREAARQVCARRFGRESV